MPRTLNALYGSHADAEDARAMLVNAGVPQSEIDIHDQSAYGDHTTSEHKGGMMASLKSFFGAHEDHQAYAEGLSRGQTLLSATVADAQADQAVNALEASKAIDFDRNQQDWRASGWSGASTYGDAAYTDQTAPMNQTAYADRSADATRSGATDDVIQVAEERLVVGKREVERGGVRVRSYIVETPVSEQVALREERVSIERRPVNRAMAAGDDAFRDRTIQMRETGEEATVGKEAFVTEEIGIHKDVSQRTEEVRDTVRHTEVEIEDLNTSDQPSDRRI